MKKLLFFLLLLSACSKKQVGSNLVDITYEVQTTVTGFNQLRYMEYKSESEGSVLVDWNITSSGTFTKMVKIPKGTLAEISGIHPTSNSWKIIIHSSNGTVLNQSDAISYFPGPPSYYYKTVDASAQ